MREKDQWVRAQSGIKISIIWQLSARVRTHTETTWGRHPMQAAPSFTLQCPTTTTTLGYLIGFWARTSVVNCTSQEIALAMAKPQSWENNVKTTFTRSSTEVRWCPLPSAVPQSSQPTLLPSMWGRKASAPKKGGTAQPRACPGSGCPAWALPH